MTVHGQEVFPDVIVVVQKRRSPTKEWNSYFRIFCIIAYIRKIGVSVIAIQRLVVGGEGGVEDVEKTDVSIVADGNPHGRRLTALLVESVAGGVAHIFKGSVTVLVKEVVPLARQPVRPAQDLHAAVGTKAVTDSVCTRLRQIL